MHPAGVPSIKCTICSTVTNLAQPQAQTNCCHCGTAMLYPRGAPSVKCYVCHTVTSVPIHVTPNEALVRELMASLSVSSDAVLDAMRDQLEQSKPVDDKAALTERLRTIRAEHPPPLDVRALLADMEQRKSDSSAPSVVHAIGAAFSRQRVLARSFLVAPGAPATPTNHGINFDEVRRFYCAALAMKCSDVMKALNDALLQLLTRPVVIMSLEDLRLFLIILEHPQFTDAAAENARLTRTAALVASLASDYKSTLIGWFAAYTPDMFRRLVAVMQLAITCRLYTGRLDMHTDYQVVCSTQVLGMLSIANQNARRVPFTEFYNTALNEMVRPEKDFELWRRGAGAFSFCNHPFVLNPATKARVMQLDAAAQMESELQAAVVNLLYSGQQSTPFLVLVVRRDHIVQDTLDQIAGKKWDLKKKLKVKFQGEEGIDAGGVQKEFFQLIMREIFDPRYGMFTLMEDTRLYWFSQVSLPENENEYELIGVLLGLAIYNSVILDMHFPVVVYKKLMGYQPTLEDLHQLNPQLASGLQQLLDFEGDVENTFCRTFQVSYEEFDSVKTVNLKPDGDKIAVTNSNRREFVDRYVRWYLSQSIEKQFAAFARGFHRVCGGQALSLFRPEELELLVCGSTELDFQALEKVCKYENGYSSSHKVVKWFWEIVHDDLSLAEKKKLLFFVTGSDRVPIKGLGTLNFVIIRNGSDSMRLPTAHTCFNQLLLPEYKNKAKLKERLVVAISNAEGFGLK